MGWGPCRWWLFWEAVFPLAGAAGLAPLARGLEHLAVVAAVTGSEVLGNVLSSGFCLCVSVPATPAATCRIIVAVQGT